MSEQKVWKLTKTKSRKLALKEISNFVKEENFSKLMDIVFYLAIQRLKDKDKFRRDIQGNISAYKFIPEDFTW